MSFLGRRAPDPKDDLIAELRSERDYLRAKVEQLEKQLLALHDAHAYRLLHPADAPRPPARPSEPTPYEKRGQVHEPKESLAVLQQKADGRIVN